VRQTAPVLRAWIADAFADERYAGNPAAVIIAEDGFPALATMQATAAALGLPTTAFVVPIAPAHYRIRWFTPAKELNICGHATIATTGYLYDIAGVDRATELRFDTQTGPLYARWQDGFVGLNLPRMDATECAPPPGLEDALGARALYCARAVDDLLVLLESEDAVARLAPDFTALGRIESRGIVVTAPNERQRADFVSRSFFPAWGVDEDQVCVSAHCKLGPYWARRLGKDRLETVQLSARGGRLLLEVTPERVHVAGSVRVRQSPDQPILVQAFG
jgi:predicted PhzF superfamily epimerase YddE/YHI9